MSNFKIGDKVRLKPGQEENVRKEVQGLKVAEVVEAPRHSGYNEIFAVKILECDDKEMVGKKYADCTLRFEEYKGDANEK